MLQNPFILDDDSPLKIYKGSRFERIFEWKTDDVAVDLTGYTFEAMFRAKYKSDDPIISLTTSGGGLPLYDAVNGKVQMILTPTETDLFEFSLSTPNAQTVPYHDFVFDIDAIPPTGTAYRFQFLKGVARVYGEVTR